jgi:hypothetical protein
MNKIISSVGIIILAAVLSSCKSDSANGPNELGGDTNIALAQVGNTGSTGSILVGGNYYDGNTSFRITKNDNGVATIKVSADLRNIPGMQSYLSNVIPSSYKDLSGKIDTEIKLKMTSEGIQDYFNVDNKPQTLVKYNATVGDKYSLTLSNGKTKTRTVTAKSTTDDTEYGFMYIKTVTVESNSIYPGFRKTIYKANHKFGLVYAQVVAEDGSSMSAYFYPTSY